MATPSLEMDDEEETPLEEMSKEKLQRMRQNVVILLENVQKTIETLTEQMDQKFEAPEEATNDKQWRSKLDAGFSHDHGDGRDGRYRYYDAEAKTFRSVREERLLTGNGRHKAAEIFRWFAEAPENGLRARIDAALKTRAAQAAEEEAAEAACDVSLRLDEAIAGGLDVDVAGAGAPKPGSGSPPASLSEWQPRRFAAPAEWTHEDFKAWWCRAGRPPYVEDCILRDEEAFQMFMRELTDAGASNLHQKDWDALAAVPEEARGKMKVAKPFTISAETFANFLNSVQDRQALERDVVHMRIPLQLEENRTWHRGHARFARLAFEQQTYGRGQDWIDMKFLPLLLYEATRQPISGLQGRLAADRILNLRTIQAGIRERQRRKNSFQAPEKESKDGPSLPRGSNVPAADSLRLHTFMGWLLGRREPSYARPFEAMLIRGRFEMYRALRGLCDGATFTYGMLDGMVRDRIFTSQRLKPLKDHSGTHEVRLELGPDPEEAGDGFMVTVTLYPGERQGRKKAPGGPRKGKTGAVSKPHRMDVPAGSGLILAFDLMVRESASSKQIAKACASIDKLVKEYLHPLFYKGLPEYYKCLVTQTHSEMIDGRVVRVMVLWKRSVDARRFIKGLNVGILPYMVVKEARVEISSNVTLLDLLEDTRFCMERDFNLRVEGKCEVFRALASTILREVLYRARDMQLWRRLREKEACDDQLRVRNRTLGNEKQTMLSFPKTLERFWSLFYPLIARGRPDGGPGDTFAEEEEVRKAHEELEQAREFAKPKGIEEETKAPSLPPRAVRKKASKKKRSAETWTGTGARRLAVRATTNMEKQAERDKEDRVFEFLLNCLQVLKSSKATIFEMSSPSVEDLLASRHLEAAFHRHIEHARGFLGEGNARRSLHALLAVWRDDIAAMFAESIEVRQRATDDRRARTVEEVQAAEEEAARKARLMEKLAKLGISQTDLDDFEKSDGPGEDASCHELYKHYREERATAIDSARAAAHAVSDACEGLCTVNLQASDMNLVVEIDGLEIFDVLKELIEGRIPGDFSAPRPDDGDASDVTEPDSGSETDSDEDDDFTF